MSESNTKKEKRIRSKASWLSYARHEGDVFTKLSFVVFGASNIARKQIVKGLLYLFLEISFIVYMAEFGIDNIKNMITLGTRQQDKVFNEATGMFDFIQGDNSMLMLLAGVTTIFIIVFFVFLWISSVKSAVLVQQLKKKNKKIPTIADDVKSLFDSNIHKLLLAIPVIGLVIFTVLPLAYMILMAFTNYDVNHQPPGKLFEWVGLETFHTILGAGSKISQTFWPVFGWTIIWAIFATFTNYFGGILLAILIGSKGIKGKAVWRTVFVITIAVPIFVSLSIIRLMLQPSGAFNILLQQWGFTTAPLPFFTNPTWARVTVIVVNMWVGIPHTMLIATGILTNIPAELYESSKIDGASPMKTFIKITMPYVFFITTPYLITNFISNINNFGVIYFLTQGGPNTLDYFKGAGKTDLLVTWLYKLTSDSKDYSYAAAIGIVIFAVSATLSLIVYNRTGAYKDEEGFQ